MPPFRHRVLDNRQRAHGNGQPSSASTPRFGAAQGEAGQGLSEYGSIGSANGSSQQGPPLMSSRDEGRYDTHSGTSRSHRYAHYPSTGQSSRYSSHSGTPGFSSHNRQGASGSRRYGNGSGPSNSRQPSSSRDLAAIERLQRIEVIEDMHRRPAHSGLAAETQFDFNLYYVRRIVEYMQDTYDTVTCYSLGMLQAGDLIYYLQPYTVGTGEIDQQAVFSGNDRSSARMRMKGRFGVVQSRFGEHLKVAACYTFGGRGLARAKPRRVWDEYVGIRGPGLASYSHPCPRPLEVDFACLDFTDDSSVHLVTDKVSLSNQIMICGRISYDSLGRLRNMVRDVEESLSR